MTLPASRHATSRRTRETARPWPARLPIPDDTNLFAHPAEAETSPPRIRRTAVLGRAGLGDNHGVSCHVARTETQQTSPNSKRR